MKLPRAVAMSMLSDGCMRIAPPRTRTYAQWLRAVVT